MEAFVLPRLDGTIEELQRSQYFDTFDLVLRYWQAAMDLVSRRMTVRSALFGLHRFDVLPFDVCSSPAPFQRLMEKAIGGSPCLICYREGTIV